MNKPKNAFIVLVVCAFYFIFLIGPLALSTQGQSPAVVAGTKMLTGSIISETNQPVIQATVSLLQVDSALVLTSKSDSSGAFKLLNVQAGQYLVRITHVGLETIYQPISVSDSVANTLPIRMTTKALNLAEISVKGKRPLVEILGDRTILNIEDNPLFSGGTTLDLLSLAPRLSIDVISRKVGIDDKVGVILYQNNRQVYLPSDRIVPYLQSLPANSIARIEILTNPPARYDANSGGVILLFTKDFYRQGTSVDLALTAGSGRYAKANASLNLSIQKGKWEGKLLYTPSYRPVYYFWTSEQTLLPYRGNSEAGFSNGEQFNKVDNSAHLIRTDWLWKLSKSQTIGAVLFFNQISETLSPTSTIEYRLAGPSTPVTRLSSNSQLRSQQVNLSANINYQYIFKNPQTTLSFDADVAHYTDNSRSKAEYSPTAVNQSYPEERLLIDYPNDILIRTAKVDFTSPLGKKGDWEMGVKYSGIAMSNQPQLLSATAGFDTLKSSLIRAFRYDEHTSAAYGSFSYQWEHVSLRAGLRLEHTDYTAQVNGTQRINRNYTNLFPSLNIQYTTPQKYQYSLNANRRIVRPAFDILNPSYIFYNPITLYTGNPLLLPQLSTTVQVGVTTPHRLSLTFAYNYGKNRITEILYRTDSITPVVLNYYINFDWEKRYSVVVSLPVKINSVWQIQGTLTGLMSRFYSTFDNAAILTTQPTGIVRLINTFSAKKLSATVSFTYRNTAVIGYMKYKPIWYLDAGLQYAINQQSSLKVSATDIFHTLLLQNYGNYLNTSINYHHRSETQQILLTYTFRFGRTKAPAVNERELGSESEQQRLGGNR